MWTAPVALAHAAWSTAVCLCFPSLRRVYSRLRPQTRRWVFTNRRNRRGCGSQNEPPALCPARGRDSDGLPHAAPILPSSRASSPLEFGVSLVTWKMQMELVEPREQLASHRSRPLRTQRCLGFPDVASVVRGRWTWSLDASAPAVPWARRPGGSGAWRAFSTCSELVGSHPLQAGINCVSFTVICFQGSVFDGRLPGLPSPPLSPLSPPLPSLPSPRPLSSPVGSPLLCILIDC